MQTHIPATLALPREVSRRKVNNMAFQGSKLSDHVQAGYVIKVSVITVEK